MDFPNLLIVTNYRALFAYLVQPDGRPQVIERIEFQSEGQTGVPVVSWRGGEESYAALAEKISAILSRYHPKSWGLACPVKLCEKLTEVLPVNHKETLAIKRTMNVEDVRISNVLGIFRGNGSGAPELELEYA